jgi:hypothetical protein
LIEPDPEKGMVGLGFVVLQFDKKKLEKIKRKGGGG